MLRFAPVLLLFFSAAVVAGAPDALLPPITALKGIKAKPNIFKAATRKKPLVIRSEKDAADYYSPKALAALKEKVDFEKQFVLVFAWRGSGQDRLSYDVLESFPEQIVFKYKPGRTRDLRPHVHTYALRNNVKWSTR